MSLDWKCSFDANRAAKLRHVDNPFILAGPEAFARFRSAVFPSGPPAVAPGLLQALAGRAAVLLVAAFHCDRLVARKHFRDEDLWASEAVRTAASERTSPKEMPDVSLYVGVFTGTAYALDRVLELSSKSKAIEWIGKAIACEAVRRKELDLDAFRRFDFLSGAESDIAKVFEPLADEEKSKGEGFMDKWKTVLSDMVRSLLKKSLQLRYRDSISVPTFVEGNTGLYVLCAKYGLLKDIKDRLQLFADHSDEMESDEILYGRAGFLHSCLFANQPKIASTIFKDIIQSGLRVDFGDGALYYEWHGKPYFGAAHGISGILHSLLCCEERISKVNDSAVECMELTGKSFLKLQFSSGNFPTRSHSTTAQVDEMVQWCHGAPGVLPTLLKLSKRFPSFDEQYLQAAICSADSIWQRGLLVKGVGLCHGIAGNGYSFLYMASHIYKKKSKKSAKAKDEDATLNTVGDYILKALIFQEIGFRNLQQLLTVPDEPFSLMNGICGFSCYIMDLIACTDSFSQSQSFSPYFPCFDDLYSETKKPK